MRFLILFLGTGLFAQVNDRIQFTNDALSRQSQIQDRIKQSRWTFGALALSPIYGIDRIGWDSNIYSSQDDQSSDFFVAPRIGMDSFYRPTPRFVWLNGARYNYVYYQENEALRGSEYDLESRIYVLRDRLYFDAGVNYLRNQLRFNSEIDDRPFRIASSASTSLIYTLKPRHKVTLDGRYEETRFDIPEDLTNSQLPNLEENSSSFVFGYYFQRNALSWPFLEAGSTHHDFVLENNPRDDSRFDSLNLGMRTPSHLRFNYRLAMGGTKMSFSQSPESDQTILTINGYGNYKSTRRATFEFRGQRNPVFSTYLSNNFFISSLVGMGYAYQLKNRFTLVPNCSYGTNSYTSPRDPNEVHREDKLYKLAFEIRMPYRRLFELRTSIGYARRDSNFESTSDRGWEISTTMTPAAL